MGELRGGFRSRPGGARLGAKFGRKPVKILRPAILHSPPGPRIRKGVLADPVLVVIVWWPRIEGYTHQLSAVCVRGSVSTGGLCECGCSPPRAQTPTLTAETGQTAGVGWSTLQCG